VITAMPDEVAKAIVAAHSKRRNEIYVRAVWRPIMAVIRALPEAIFKRLTI
jgi:decaprenylphospho-beta-D-erythro-pentofuranosid-2-ulose 2-reductase